MAATLRELRGRIRSAGSIKKITRAQELIATSRITKAQARLQAARPYAAEITRMLTTLATEAALDHPLLVERPNPSGRVFWWCPLIGACAAHTTPVCFVAQRNSSRCSVKKARPRCYTLSAVKR
ncbi:ATP synthase family protein [Mycobacterium xenopi 4042]|uniref:ATP synthase family protein n=1 Tax=Mycobacterium xenopi 4042 TaxID=1299334 RepID=X8DXZ6_MYCXE|nr:ATP synthase family protein [Mycobacterium xenopi 4042]